MIEINIAQALENYANSISDGYQTYLAYGGKTDSVVEGDLVVLYDAVNLIKRQQAEIEMLKGWERLLKAESHAPIIQKAKRDAIIEFAERLKKKYEFHIICDWRTLNGEIDDLVKEMLGGSDGVGV